MEHCVVRGSRGLDHTEGLDHAVFDHAEGLDHAKGLDTAEGPPACFLVASGGDLSEGYGYGGPGVYLGDGQTEVYLKDMDMAGLASALAMTRRRTKEYRHNVDAATRCSAYAPIPDLTWVYLVVAASYEIFFH